MQSIQNTLQNYSFKKTKVSERAEVIKSIYEIYSSKEQKDFRKKENWKRYCLFCREHKIANSQKAINKFKRDKRFIREKDIKAFCVSVSHIKEVSDLYYLLSVAKDCVHRKEPFILNFKA